MLAVKRVRARSRFLCIIIASFKIEGETTYAIQFHPEVYHTTDGKQILENFLVHIGG
ncbi:hypothetical protein, partial [Pseudomonas sp.]|uniref:glutamine amidotransferase-related protein n=1 Tax=Pseudomonas sp. TaxID=306 RepID=UPI00345C46CF